MFLNTRVLCYLWWYESSFSRWVTNSRLSQLSQPNSTSSIWSSWPWCRNSNWSRSSCNSKPTAPPLQTAHTSVSHRHSRLSHRSWFPLSSVTLTVFLLPRQGLANTLDQASAQIAASALVTADQLLALKPKEELALGGGVNGVLSPSGMTTVLQRLKFQTSQKH